MRIAWNPTRSGFFFRESERGRGEKRLVLNSTVAVLREDRSTRRLWFLR